MALTMELDEAVAGNSPELSTEFNLKRMYENVPVRTLPPVPEWREMPITHKLPSELAVQIRVRHRRLMAFRWRFRELRVKDFEAKHLPRDWHEWMECDGGEYGVYNCTCDAWDNPPVTRASGRRAVVRTQPELKVVDHEATVIQIVVDTSTSCIESPSDALEPRIPWPSDHHRVARRYSPRSVDGTHIQICHMGLVHHDVLAASNRPAARSDERLARGAQRRLRITMGPSRIWGGVYAVR